MSGARLAVFKEVIAEVRFTPREIEFMKLRCGELLSYSQIAERMGISKRTVTFFQGCISMKLGCSGAQTGDCGPFSITMTKFAIKHGIIEL
jgi:DNA-binding CsgD family transcriptional regulator